MRTFLIILSCLLIMPVFASEWLTIKNANITYDKSSITETFDNVYSVILKSPADNGLELRSRVSINCSFKRYNFAEYKLFDPMKGKFVYRQLLDSNWDDIPKDSNLIFLYEEICQ